MSDGVSCSSRADLRFGLPVKTSLYGNRQIIFLCRLTYKIVYRSLDIVNKFFVRQVTYKHTCLYIKSHIKTSSKLPGQPDPHPADIILCFFLKATSWVPEGQSSRRFPARFSGDFRPSPTPGTPLDRRAGARLAHQFPRKISLAAHLLGRMVTREKSRQTTFRYRDLWATFGVGNFPLGYPCVMPNVFFVVFTSRP